VISIIARGSVNRRAIILAGRIKLKNPEISSGNNFPTILGKLVSKQNFVFVLEHSC
jgi:hypothetical protein